MQRAEEVSRHAIDAHGKTSAEINRHLKELIRAGRIEIVVRQVEAQHNLAVGIISPVSIVFQGSVGYYCGGLMDGPAIEIQGSAGWGLGESMLSGSIRVTSHAGNSCAASIRGGTVVVDGSVGARAGVAMKGGLLIVGGNCGYMTGFMMQRGVIIVCGNSGPALADSMYEGIVFVGGKIQDLGNDAVVQEPDDADREFLRDSLGRWEISAERPFKKIVAGRKLWNFDRKEIDIWKQAL
jgi:methylamine---glutamate N-methyltransferase subunit B